MPKPRGGVEGEARVGGAPRSAARINFRKDPLAYFDYQLQEGKETFWLSSRVLCVAEPRAAKAVLANPDGLFEEHSDFFHTRRGPFGPRALQVAIGRASRQLLNEHLAGRAAALPETIARHLVPSSTWPDAGNRLIYHHLAAALVAPPYRDRIGSKVEQVLELGVLAGVRERRSRLARALFRRRTFRALSREVGHRVEEGNGHNGQVHGQAPRDLFDVLASVAGPEVRTADLGELYLPLFFAVVSSVGFTLGWTLYLLGTNPPTDARSAWIVREALRLWPVAWQLVRRPARRHQLAGVEVTSEHEVLVSPYVTQRHPAYWHEPDRFLPQRWADDPDQQAFLPFGWGPHTCTGAGLTLELATAALTVLRRDYRLQVSPQSDRPFIGPSLAPPRFRLDLYAKNSDPSVERR